MRGVEISSKRYDITLKDKVTGISTTVSLSRDRTKWVVRADGFNGWYKSLDVAMEEAFRRLSQKVDEKGGE